MVCYDYRSIQNQKHKQFFISIYLQLGTKPSLKLVEILAYKKIGLPIQCFAKYKTCVQEIGQAKGHVK